MATLAPRRRALLWTVGWSLALGCGAEPPASPAPALAGASLSADAKLSTVAMLWDDLAAPRHPSDGGGRAWLDRVVLPEGESELRAGGRARFEITYEAGPLGIAMGGTIFLQVSPFWEWSTPQNESPDFSGYTVLRSDAAGVELQPETLAAQLMGITIAGRSLAAGERVRIVFGAGPRMAQVDRFAERSARLWLAVDGDGDGVRALIEDPLTVDIAAGLPARMVALAPSTVRPGDPFRLTVSVLDADGNAGVAFEGDVELSAPEELELPTRITFSSADRGSKSVEGRASSEGIYAAVLRSGDFAAESNPIVVSASAPRVLWADFHGHTQLSDGTGTPEDFFAYARDVAALDIVAVTDHDHWGMRFLDQEPKLWADTRETVSRYHQPGRFVALLGYEWTSWLYGHRHVVYFQDDGAIESTLDLRTQSPAGLWAALAGQAVLTFAHHSAGGPISTDWSFRPDPQIEPVTEIASVHGSSEALDAPSSIYNPVPGNFARDALDLGMRFGFIGSGDSHDGHPGLAQLASPTGGLAAIFAEELTREAVLAALRARRCYATNGPRIWMRTALDGQPMGSLIDPSENPTQVLDVAVAAPGKLVGIDVIHSGQLAETIEVDGDPVWAAELTIPRLESGEYLYVRVRQADGGAAWSSPIYAR